MPDLEGNGGTGLAWGAYAGTVCPAEQYNLYL